MPSIAVKIQIARRTGIMAHAGSSSDLADFASFIEAVGPRPSTDHSLDRIDNNGHYEAGNVKWSTRAMSRSTTGVR